jgi:H3 lysine-79-specific histone-lysine N-methyltransferase
VLHVAAVSNCKMCYGFEKSEWPAKYAELMEKEFIFWMNFFGKSYSNFKIYKGDFLSDKESVLVESPLVRNSTMNEYVQEIINEAKLVFVNNYAFGAEMDHQLKLRFSNMTEGAFIISCKPFSPLNFSINSRNLDDISTIINFSDFEPLSGNVSWTNKIINYYFQKIDRTHLEKYFEKRKNPLAKKAKKTVKKAKKTVKKDDEKAAEASSKIHSPTGSTSTTRVFSVWRKF